MLLMLLDSLDLGHLPHGSVTDLRDAAAYTLLYFTSQRIGHVEACVPSCGNSHSSAPVVLDHRVQQRVCVPVD